MPGLIRAGASFLKRQFKKPMWSFLGGTVIGDYFDIEVRGEDGQQNALENISPIMLYGGLILLVAMVVKK